MNDIDTLMERISLINSKNAEDLTPKDIDDLVEYYRYRRTRKATLTQSHDLRALDAILPTQKTDIIPGTVRRF